MAAEDCWDECSEIVGGTMFYGVVLTGIAWVILLNLDSFGDILMESGASVGVATIIQIFICLGVLVLCYCAFHYLYGFGTPTFVKKLLIRFGLAVEEDFEAESVSAASKPESPGDSAGSDFDIASKPESPGDSAGYDFNATSKPKANTDENANCEPMPRRDAPIRHIHLSEPASDEKDFLWDTDERESSWDDDEWDFEKEDYKINGYESKEDYEFDEFMFDKAMYDHFHDD